MSPEEKAKQKKFYFVSQIKAVAKLNPLSGLSIPSAEANALILGVRLLEAVKEELENILEINKIIFLADSTSAILQAGSRWHLLNPFFGARAREYQSKHSYDQLYFVPSQFNPSDLCSKAFPNKTMKDILYSDLWTGNSYMSKGPISTWPIRKLERPQKMTGIIGVQEKYKGFTNSSISSLNTLSVNKKGWEISRKNTGKKSNFSRKNAEFKFHQQHQFTPKLLKNMEKGAFFDEIFANFSNLTIGKTLNTYKLPHLQRAIQNSGKVMPYFLTEKGRKEIEIKLNQGGGVEYFANLMRKRRDISKIFRILAYCLAWLPKNKKTSLVLLQIKAQKILERQSALFTKFYLKKAKNPCFFTEIGGLPYKINRAILESQLPSISMVLSEKTQYGLSILTHTHDLFHLLGFERYQAYLKMGYPSYQFINAKNTLKHLENTCPKCTILKKLPIIHTPGPFLPQKSFISPIYSLSSGDLCGPFLAKNGRNSYKIWISIIICDSSHHCSILPIEDYSSKSIMAHIRFEQCAKLVTSSYKMKKWHSAVKHKKWP